MISPLSQTGINPLRQAQSPSLLGPQAPGAVSPLGDLSSLSPESQGQDGDISQMMQALMQAFGGQQQQQTPEQRIQQLQQEIAVTEQQLGQAQQSGDEQQVQQLSQKLEALKAELAQLTGQGGEGAGAGGEGAPAGGGGGGAPEGGGAPAGGGGAPAGGGGAPAGGGGAPAGGGGGAPDGGGGGAAPVNGGGGANTGGANGTDQVGGVQDTQQVPPELAGDDKKMAEFIESKLAGTPLEGKGLGAHFVAAGKKNNVDPLALAAISKHETGHGKLGVGVAKHMGVGAFDSSPNTPRKWDGAVNQIYSGAKTFANLRRKGGSNADAPLGQQLAAVNRAGWATDKSWHSKVGKAYNSYASSARTAFASNNSSPAATRTASTSSATSTRTVASAPKSTSTKKA